jgi:hypothetical protein
MRETYPTIFLVWLLGDHDRLVQTRAVLTAVLLLANCSIYKRSHNIEIIITIFKRLSFNDNGGGGCFLCSGV